MYFLSQYVCILPFEIYHEKRLGLWNLNVLISQHYNDVIMSEVASQITSFTIAYSSIYSGTDQRKHQSSASLAFVRGIHLWPVNSPDKGPVTRKMFPFDDIIMKNFIYRPAIWGWCAADSSLKWPSSYFASSTPLRSIKSFNRSSCNWGHFNGIIYSKTLCYEW